MSTNLTAVLQQLLQNTTNLKVLRYGDALAAVSSVQRNRVL